MRESDAKPAGLTRREFVGAAAAAAAGTALVGCRRDAQAADRAATPPPAPPTAATTQPGAPILARHWESVDATTVRCTLCPRNCLVEDGQRGHCDVRENRKGQYYTLVYGRPCAANNDPIEKKPFFHVYPGAKAFSIATVGCNIDCKFCQNWDISQARPDDVSVPYRAPEAIADMAVKAGAKVVAYTYSEPTIFFEYMVDCAKAARERGLGNVVVSNGFIAEKPLAELRAAVTAIKIDFKGFSDDFYERICGAKLAPVLDTLKRLAASKVWFEIVTLLIPTLNDDPAQLKAMAAWVVKNLGTDVPLHFTRYHPAYKIRNIPPTPVQTLERARGIAMAEGCRFVYGGNVPGMLGENTYCPQCKALLVNRYGYTILADKIRAGKCSECGTAIPGVWA